MMVQPFQYDLILYWFGIPWISSNLDRASMYISVFGFSDTEGMYGGTALLRSRQDSNEMRIEHIMFFSHNYGSSARPLAVYHVNTGLTLEYDPGKPSRGLWMILFEILQSL